MIKRHLAAPCLLYYFRDAVIASPSNDSDIQVLVTSPHRQRHATRSPWFTTSLLHPPTITQPSITPTLPPPPHPAHHTSPIPATPLCLLPALRSTRREPATITTKPTTLQRLPTLRPRPIHLGGTTVTPSWSLAAAAPPSTPTTSNASPSPTAGASTGSARN